MNCSKSIFLSNWKSQLSNSNNSKLPNWWIVITHGQNELIAISKYVVMNYKQSITNELVVIIQDSQSSYHTFDIIIHSSCLPSSPFSTLHSLPVFIIQYQKVHVIKLFQVYLFHLIRTISTYFLLETIYYPTTMMRKEDPKQGWSPENMLETFFTPEEEEGWWVFLVE